MTPIEIADAISELALEPFDRAEFPFQFLASFGNKETTLKKLRAGASNASDLNEGVLQRNNIHIATCAIGAVNATLTALRESPKTASAKVKFILATDGEEFQAEDLASGETVACDYTNFDDHFGFFLPLAGVTNVKEVKETELDRRAANRLKKLYVELLSANPDWAGADRREDMNKFMARLIFCFFAEDTDIIHPSGLFTQIIEQMSSGDASDTHHVISEIFRAMDAKLADREAAGLPIYAKKFPYVNGGLFSDSIDCPRFTKITRSYLFHIGNLDWKRINPDIFGSMMQAVADDEERGAVGMHYTSVPNILKVLNPLFLNNLREKLEEAGDNSRKLLNLRNRIASIRVFDPACGSGNFLVIAYKEMRAIEAVINKRRGEYDRRSEISVKNFRGIELRPFAAEIARLALIIAEYQCDVLYRGQKEALAEFLPLNSENWITCDNALRLDWLSVCPPTGKAVKLRGDDLFGTPLDQAEIEFANEGGETYLCGNPPYKGDKVQSAAQKSDMASAFAGSSVAWKSLDYVCGWFYKAALFNNAVHGTSALVATNSICQGQQVPNLWPAIFGLGQEIVFAHTSFKWTNLASHNAGVTVVVIGMSANRLATRSLFESDSNDCDVVRVVSSINAYLTSGANLIVAKASHPISTLPPMVLGNMAKDGGNLIVESDEISSLELTEIQLKKFVRPLVGSREFINGLPKYCLWIRDDDLNEVEAIPSIRRRIAATRAMRLASTKGPTRGFARVAHRFVEIRFDPDAASDASQPTIILPRITSENREYLPAGICPPTFVPNSQNFALFDTPIWVLAIIISRIHIVWTAAVCGRTRTDFAYSTTMGWNTFPLPKLTEQNKADLTVCAENILLAREAHFPATIADLYDPEAMPENLRRAHDENDEVLERIYIGRRFKNDTERLEKLFELYAKIIAKGKAV